MREDTTLTIFTPTYNRAYILPKLYMSLCQQTDREFIWIIVDDGSTDNTKKLINDWIAEKKIEIKYFFQENAGKMQAHNTGVRLTNTTLFSCVDSDDYLVNDAVEKIKKCYINHKIDIGILCKRGKDEHTPITKWKGDFFYSTMFDAEKKRGLIGDTMLIFKTEVLKRHFFPCFQGEKFVPESYLYDQLSCEGKLYFYPEILYICEYLSDGYTANIRKTNAKNPYGYTEFITQRIKMDTCLIDKFFDTIRYIAIRCVLKDKKMIKNAPCPILALLCYIPGIIFYRVVYFKWCS